MSNHTTKDASQTTSKIQPCNEPTCLFTLVFGSISTNIHLTDHFNHYNQQPVTLTRTSRGSTDVAVVRLRNLWEKTNVSRCWESMSVSMHPLTGPNNVNNSVWAGAHAKMSTNNQKDGSLSMKRPQNGSLVDGKETDFMTFLPQHHHDAPKCDDLQWCTASIDLKTTQYNINFSSTPLYNHTLATFPCIFSLLISWVFLRKDTVSKSRFISAPESMKVHSFDPGAWSRHMITRARQEESVGLFKVVHGDLFGDVFVMGRNW